MPITAKAKLCANLTLTNGNVIELHEGDVIQDLVYKKNGVETTVSGAIRVLDVTTKTNTVIPSECPPEPYSHKYIAIESMVIDSSTMYDAELTRVSIASVVSIGSVVKDGGEVTIGVGPQFKTLSEVLTSAENGDVIHLEDGVYSQELTFTKGVKIVGGANSVLSGLVTINAAASTEPVAVELVGVKLTSGAVIKITNVNTFTMTGCTFENHTLTDAKSYPVLVQSSNPVVMKVNNNVFGTETSKSYNLFEIDAPLATGTEICGNTFKGDSCVHNHINVYQVVDNAVIEINNNTCEMSRNMVRIGIKGQPKCTINMKGNTYLATDSDANYAGLFLVQPYGTATTSFANCTINVSNTTKPAGQLYYLYAGTNDMQFTATNQPKIVVDGVVQAPKTFA